MAVKHEQRTSVDDPAVSWNKSEITWKLVPLTKSYCTECMMSNDVAVKFQK